MSNASIYSNGPEIHRIPVNLQDNLNWVAFKRRMADAGAKAGFDGLTAKGFVGAFGEMLANAMEHSEQPTSAIVGYKGGHNEFEFVVADSGIGLLASLRSCSDYSHVKDHAQALNVALTYGESKYGKNSGRGTGFETVFKNLATLSGSLRFRTGDQSLTIDGKSPTLAHAKVHQRAQYRGFLVSITCRI
jgi:hypothetical protein